MSNSIKMIDNIQQYLIRAHNNAIKQDIKHLPVYSTHSFNPYQVEEHWSSSFVGKCMWFCTLKNKWKEKSKDNCIHALLGKNEFKWPWVKKTSENYYFSITKAFWLLATDLQKQMNLQNSWKCGKSQWLAYTECKALFKSLPSLLVLSKTLKSRLVNLQIKQIQ